jgi:hypothetical protein
MKKRKMVWKSATAVALACAIALTGTPGSGAWVSRAENNVEASGSSVIVGAKALSEEQSDIYLSFRPAEESLKQMFPETLDVTLADGSSRTVPVTWETAEDYAAEEVYFYLYDPVIEGYEVADSAELPYVVVWIDDQAEYFSALDGNEGDGTGQITAGEGSEGQGTGEGTEGQGSGEGTGDQGTGEGTEGQGSGEGTGDQGTGEGTGTGDQGTGEGEQTTTETPAEETPQQPEHLQDLVRTDVTVDKSANELEIYNYLRNEFGLNQAAATGVLANINAESGYRQNALGDKNTEGYYTSFGLCQWHNSRWESLISFCNEKGVDWQTVRGQMMYLQYELENVSRFKTVIETLRTVPNNEQGAYQAAYIFCYRFEVPANRDQKSDSRGRVARDKFWPRFGGYTTEDGVFCIWKSENGFSYWYENDVRQGTLTDARGVMGDNTIRGREIYDPLTNGWYWLDAVYEGAKAVNKEVWMPYIYSNETDFDEAAILENAARSPGMEEQVIAAIHAHGGIGGGKWVRYNSEGRMILGWYTVGEADAEYYPDQVGNTYYYDPVTGLMAKGTVTIDGKEYTFDEVSGALVK